MTKKILASPQTFVIGDIHGGYKALLQCIERSGINPETDTLISLGDVADGWPEVPECFDKLLEFKHIYIIGNHDDWLLSWFRTRSTPDIWIQQGGQATLDAYQKMLNKGEFDRISNHQNILEHALPSYVDDDNNLFVHGGIDWHSDSQSRHDMMWDRHMWEVACFWERREPDKTFDKYKLVFIGHTTTAWLNEETLTWQRGKLNSLKPIKASNVWNLDQGGGYEGKLTIMNVETEEYWQSDIVKTLYPDAKLR